MLEKFIAFQLFMIAERDEEKGATAVEYGLLVALIAAVIVEHRRASSAPRSTRAFSTVSNAASDELSPVHSTRARCEPASHTCGAGSVINRSG